MSLVSGTTGCKCTTAKVPKVTLDSDDTTVLEFEFEIGETVRELKDIFTATVQCEGAISQISLYFVCEFNDVVNFVKPDNIVYYHERDELQYVQLPIVCSANVKLSELEVIAGSDLLISKPRLVVKNDKPYVEIAMDSRRFNRKEIVDTIELRSKNKTLATQLLTLKYDAKLKFLPPTPVVQLSLERDTKRVASIFLKLTGDSSVGETTVKSVSCRLHDGEELECDYQSTSPGIYKLTLSAAVEEFTTTTAKIDWRIVKGNDEVFEVQTGFVLTN